MCKYIVCCIYGNSLAVRIDVQTGCWWILATPKVHCASIFRKNALLQRRAIRNSSIGIRTQCCELIESSTVTRSHAAVYSRIGRQNCAANPAFTSVHGTQSLGGLWLSGGGATLSGLEDALYQRLSLPCEVLNPFSLFKNNVAKRKRPLVDGQRFSTAAGLALRGLAWLESEHVA